MITETVHIAPGMIVLLGIIIAGAAWNHGPDTHVVEDAPRDATPEEEAEFFGQ